MRFWRALLYSRDGLRAAVRHEAAFRQELAIGVPLIVLAWRIAPGRWTALAMTVSIMAVFVVELLNSAMEALADAVCGEAQLHARYAGAGKVLRGTVSTAIGPVFVQDSAEAGGAHSIEEFGGRSAAPEVPALGALLDAAEDGELAFVTFWRENSARRFGSL